MAFGLSTENARKWSRKGKSLHPEVLGPLEEGCKKGECMAKTGGVTTALWAGFGEKEWFAGVCSAKASKFETWFGPQGAVKNELSSLSRDSVEATKARNGTPEVAPSATGNPHLCP
jgi:hypothetical protein